MTKDDFENFWISSAFVYHDSRQREENQILPLGHFEWFRYKSPTSLRLSSKGYFCELKLHGPWEKLLDGHPVPSEVLRGVMFWTEKFGFCWQVLMQIMLSKINCIKRWIRNASEPYEYPWSKWGINVTFSYIYSNFWHNDNNCIAFHSWSCLLGDSRTTCKVMGSHKPGTVIVPETGSTWFFEPC